MKYLLNVLHKARPTLLRNVVLGSNVKPYIAHQTVPEREFVLKNVAVLEVKNFVVRDVRATKMVIVISLILVPRVVRHLQSVEAGKHLTINVAMVSYAWEPNA